jgi:hypothetical protein
MEEYLQASEVIDWQHPTILELARRIASEHQTPQAIAKACFEWVRDKIVALQQYLGTNYPKCSFKFNGGWIPRCHYQQTSGSRN